MNSAGARLVGHDAATTASASVGLPARLQSMRPYWFILIACAIFAIPGLTALGTDYWTTEQGAQGPIILITGLWLLWRESADWQVEFDPRRTQLGLAAVVGICLATVFVSILGKQWVQWALTYAVFLSLLFVFFGQQPLRKGWFPLFYLLFLIPPPPFLILPLTHFLKVAIADASVAVLNFAGYEVANNGSSLFIGQYELVVAAACAGMNSLLSLMAIGLFYIYLLHRADVRYSIILGMLVIPIAVFANFCRVIFLLLITYHFGNEVGQGMLHDAAGMIVFLVALFALMAIDGILAPRLARRVKA